MIDDTNLQFRSHTTLVDSNSECFRPPSFPPPDDWVITFDKDAKPLSRYGDFKWDYSAFGFSGFRFDRLKLSDRNTRLIKQVLLFVLYSNLFPGKIGSCRSYFNQLTHIARVCDQHNITLSEISRFPKLLPLISKAIPKGNYPLFISNFHRLLTLKNDLGLVVLDEPALTALAHLQASHERVQHPYIPPRIWNYHVNRLSECIQDFHQHKVTVLNSLNALAEAYESNKKLANREKHGNKTSISPFNKRKHFKGQVILAVTFEAWITEQGLAGLLQKWLSDRDLKLRTLSSYLNLVRDSSLLYILSFSLQRNGEACSLRCDCYPREENDPKLGKVGLIVGETTKTIDDNDARWVVPRHVKTAVDAAATIAKWRAQFMPKNLFSNEIKNPFLATATWEPWAISGVKYPHHSHVNYDRISKHFPKLFDPKKTTVTEEDWRITLSLTPNLGKKEGFDVGKPWHFSVHQLRRTMCVNLFSSELVSDISSQWQMKHTFRNQTLYYARHYTSLRLNNTVQNEVILELYRSIYRQLCEVVTNTIENIRPHQREIIPENIIRLVDESEEKKLLKLIKDGKAGCRKTLLGFCMKNGTCEYGGIESVAQCASPDGICADAIFRRRNKDKLIKLKDKHQKIVASGDKHSPRCSAALQEIHAIEVYLNAI